MNLKSYVQVHSVHNEQRLEVHLLTHYDIQPRKCRRGGYVVTGAS